MSCERFEFWWPTLHWNGGQLCLSTTFEPDTFQPAVIETAYSCSHTDLTWNINQVGFEKNGARFVLQQNWNIIKNVFNGKRRRVTLHVSTICVRYFFTWFVMMQARRQSDWSYFIVFRPENGDIHTSIENRHIFWERRSHTSICWRRKPNRSAYSTIDIHELTSLCINLSLHSSCKYFGMFKSIMRTAELKMIYSISSEIIRKSSNTTNKDHVSAISIKSLRYLHDHKRRNKKGSFPAITKFS